MTPERGKSGDHQCEARINGEWGPRCRFKAKAQIAGSWLCGIHAKSAPLRPQDLAVRPRLEGGDE